MDTTDAWIVVIGLSIFLIIVFVFMFYLYNYAYGDEEETKEQKDSDVGVNTNNIDIITYGNSNITTDITYDSLKGKPDLFDGKYDSLTGKPKLFDGQYDSLKGKPNMFDGRYNSLTGKPDLFDGDYNNLTNKPRVFDGRYDNLTGKPELFDGRYSSLSGLPDLFDGNYHNLQNKPILFNGSYSNLRDKPTLFDGNYNSLTNKPTIFDGNYDNLTNKPTLFDGQYDSLTGTPTLFDGQYNSLIGKPDLSALSVEWSNISNKPDLNVTGNGGPVDWNSIINKPEFSIDEGSMSYHTHAAADITGLEGVVTGYINNNLSDIQTQLNGKLSSADISGLQTQINSKLSSADISSLQTQINSKVSPEQLTTLQTQMNEKVSTSQLSGLQTQINNKVSSEQLTGIQTELSNKASITHTHDASEITGFGSLLDNVQFTGAISSVQGDNLEINKVVVSDSYGKIKASELNSSKLNHLRNVSSDIQTQLNNKSQSGHTHTMSEIVDFQNPGANGSGTSWKNYYDHGDIPDDTKTVDTTIDISGYTSFPLGNNTNYREIYICFYYGKKANKPRFYQMHFMLLDDNNTFVISSGDDIVYRSKPTSYGDNKIILNGHFYISRVAESSAPDGKLNVYLVSPTRIRIWIQINNKFYDIDNVFVLGK